MRLQYNNIYITSLEDKIESFICKSTMTNLSYYKLSKQIQKEINTIKLKKKKKEKEKTKIKGMDLIQFMFRKK